MDFIRLVRRQMKKVRYYLIDCLTRPVVVAEHFIPTLAIYFGLLHARINGVEMDLKVPHLC